VSIAKAAMLAVSTPSCATLLIMSPWSETRIAAFIPGIVR